MATNRERLDELLRRRRRKARAPIVVAAWSKIGVSVSPLSTERQEAVVSKLRAAGLRTSPTLGLPSPEPLDRQITEFAASADMLLIIGWDIDEEPAALLSVEALTRSVASLRTLYPDGFLLIDQPPASALIIDFDEEYPLAFYVDRLTLTVTQRPAR